MRVHLGSDHAGLELKDHLVALAARAGPRAGRPRPVRLRRPRRLPGLLPARGREAVVADEGSLGVVIGGSGNGEQIAANKVAGVRSRAGLERRDRRARPPAQRRQRALGRRPDAHGRGDDPLRRDLPGHRLHRRGAARPPDRDARRLRGDRRPAAPARVRASGSRPPMPEGHTLHRLATSLRDGVRRRRRAGEQPAGAVRGVGRAARRHPAARGASRSASTCSWSSSRPAAVHVHLGLYGKFRRPPGAGARPGGPGAAAPGRRHGVRRPARRHRLRAGHRRAARRRSWTGSAPTRCDPDADPEPRLGADPPQPRADRRAADGPGRAGRGRQRLPRRGAVPAPAAPAAARAARCGSASSRRCGRTSSVLLPTGSAPGGSRPCAPSTARSRREAAEARTAAVRNYVYRRTGQPCLVCGAKVRTEELAGPQSVLVSALSARVPLPRRRVGRPMTEMSDLTPG